MTRTYKTGGNRAGRGSLCTLAVWVVLDASLRSPLAEARTERPKRQRQQSTGAGHPIPTSPTRFTPITYSTLRGFNYNSKCSDSRYQSVYSYRTALIGATIRETFAASARRGTCCSTQPRPSSGARARRCLRRHRPCRCCAAARARRGYAAALLASSGCAAARARRCCRRRIPCTVCATGHGDRAWV